jgi:hypothetical protein
MSNSIDKTDIKDLAFRASDNQEVPAPDAGTVLDAETLDAISAGGNASSSDHESLDIRRAQDEARTSIPMMWRRCLTAILWSSGSRAEAGAVALHLSPQVCSHRGERPPDSTTCRYQRSHSNSCPSLHHGKAVPLASGSLTSVRPCRVHMR